VDPPCSECADAFDPKKGWNEGTAGASQGLDYSEDLVLPAYADHGRKRHLEEVENIEHIFSSGIKNEKVNSTAYITPPLNELQRITTRKHHGDECHALEELPVGRHVLTVATHRAKEHETGKHHQYAISHIIEWE